MSSQYEIDMMRKNLRTAYLKDEIGVHTQELLLRVVDAIESQLAALQPKPAASEVGEPDIRKWPNSLQYAWTHIAAHMRHTTDLTLVRDYLSIAAKKINDAQAKPELNCVKCMRNVPYLINNLCPLCHLAAQKVPPTPPAADEGMRERIELLIHRWFHADGGDAQLIENIQSEVASAVRQKKIEVLEWACRPDVKWNQIEAHLAALKGEQAK